MSSVDDLVANDAALAASIQAAIDKLGQPPPPPAEDPRIAVVAANLASEKAALDAAVNPPASAHS